MQNVALSLSWGHCHVPLQSPGVGDVITSAREAPPDETPRERPHGARAKQFSISEQLLHRNVQRFRGGLVFKAHRLCVSLNSRLESNKEEEETGRFRSRGKASVRARAWTTLARLKSG